MNRATAFEIFTEVQEYYNSIDYPKYKNISLKKFKEKFEALNGIKIHLESNVLFTRLVNAMSQTIAKCERQEKLAQLPENEIWSNLSERGMNKVIRPLQKAKNIDVSFPVEWIDKWGNACYISNGFWAAKNYTVMDVLGYMFLLKEGGDSLPDYADPIFQDINAIIEREDQLSTDGKGSQLPEKADPDASKSRVLNNAYSIGFTDRDFRKNTGMDLSSSNIKDLLLETSRVEFKLSFPVRLKETGNKENIHRMNFYSRFYELCEEETKIRKDGIVQSRRYRVHFNTFLGELFVNNLKSRYNNKIDLRFYTLPDSAQIFYRRHLIHHDFSDLPIYLEKIVKSVGYTDTNITNLIKTVESNILEPLKKYGYIKSYKKAPGLKERSKGLKGVKFIIKGISNQEKSSSSNEQKDAGLVK